MLLLAGALPVHPCATEPSDSTWLVWPDAGGSTTPEAWLLVEAEQGSPYALVLLDPLGVEVPLEPPLLVGPSTRTSTLYALIPEQPLDNGPHTLLGLGEGSSEATFVVRSGVVEPVVPPVLRERTLAADIEPDQSAYCSDTPWDRVEYRLCGTHRITVAALSEDRPPENARDADLDFAYAWHVWGYARSWSSVELDAVLDVRAGEQVTVWVGAMDNVGNIRWAPPDDFRIPNDDWIVTTTALAEEADGGTCNPWEGWGPSERECGGPDCVAAPDEGCGCATGEKGGPVGLLSVLTVALRRLRRRYSSQASAIAATKLQS